MDWTPELEGALLAARERLPGASKRELAYELRQQTDLPITRDMVKNKLARLDEELPASRPDSHIRVPQVPEGDFVGFDMAFFDIETTGLGAYGSEMTCVSIADQFGRVINKTKFDFEQATVLDDKNLVVWARDELEKYDILVAWYGTMFDLPYINARLIMHGERPMRDTMFIDPIYKARGGRYGLKMGGSKLKTVAKALRTENQKPDVEWETFRLAGYGDPTALEEVVSRCNDDVLVLRDIFDRFKPMIRTIHR